MRSTLVIAFLAITAHVHASINLSAVDIEGNESITGEYRLVNTDGSFDFQSVTLPNAFSITTATTISQSIQTSFPDSHIVIPPNWRLFDTSSAASVTETASLDLTHGISFYGSTSIYLQSGQLSSIGQSTLKADMSVAIYFQVSHTPASLSLSPSNIISYYLIDLTTNQIVLNSGSFFDDPNHVSNFVLQPDAYEFKAFVVPMLLNPNQGFWQDGEGIVQLSIVPEVDSLSITGLGLSVILVSYALRRRFA